MWNPLKALKCKVDPSADGLNCGVSWTERESQIEADVRWLWHLRRRRLAT